MRPQFNLRVARLGMAGALAAASAAALAAPVAAQTGATPAPQTPAGAAAPAAAVTLSVRDRTLGYGDRFAVAGRASRQQSGRRVALQFKRSGRGWLQVATARVGRDGRFRFAVRGWRSGRFRAVLSARSATVPAAVAAVSSRTRGVSVSARIVRGKSSLDVRRGERASLRGKLAPGAGGRVVTLEQRGRTGGWKRVAKATTDRTGTFWFRFTPDEVGSWIVRVRFRGDRTNAGTVRIAGRLNSFRKSFASWYWLYGSPVACGGTLGYNELGVAHKWLPCGTMVSVNYKGRTVRVPVIDRGPYVSGREWDLTGATARRLGFNGIGRVWVTRG